LSLHDPEYISVHETSEFKTPPKLIQNVTTVELNEKMDSLYTFIKSHLKAKVIVFVSSCKQVHFIFETFSKLRPGIPLMELHGKQKQMKRMGVFYDFCKKEHAILFATDIAARGLDFPAIDWVVQLDCPEDVHTYIHRVGRTARYESGGSSLLFLLPSEQKMIELLDNNKIPVKQIKINPKQKQMSIQSRLESFIAEDPELKYLAQKAFISYLRSIFLQSNKEVFDVNKLPAESFAHSLGLTGTPKIRFGKSKTSKKNVSYDSLLKMAEEESEEENPSKKPKTKIERLFSRQNNTVLSQAYEKLREHDLLEDDNEEFLTVKKVHKYTSEDESPSSDSSHEEKEKKPKRKFIEPVKNSQKPKKIKV